jgi:hypothetical protein
MSRHRAWHRLASLLLLIGLGACGSLPPASPAPLTTGPAPAPTSQPATATLAATVTPRPATATLVPTATTQPATATAIASPTSPPPVATVTSRPAGRPAPELGALEWHNSPPLRLADLRGRTVLLVFWSDY